MTDEPQNPTPDPAPDEPSKDEPAGEPQKADDKPDAPVTASPPEPEAEMSTEDRLALLEMKEARNEAVDEYSKLYPDVPKKLLAAQSSRDAMDIVGKEWQDSIKTAKQQAVADIEKDTQTPGMTSSDKAAALADIETRADKGEPGMLQKGLSLLLTPTKSK